MKGEYRGGEQPVLASPEMKVPRGRDGDEEEGLEGACWYDAVRRRMAEQALPLVRWQSDERGEEDSSEALAVGRSWEETNWRGISGQIELEGCGMVCHSLNKQRLAGRRTRAAGRSRRRYGRPETHTSRAFAREVWQASGHGEQPMW